MLPAVARLARLVPPPAPPRPHDWSGVEARLGSALPADYRQLVDLYGGGFFAFPDDCRDQEIRLLAPGQEEPHNDLVAQSAERAEILADLWEQGEPRPAELRAAGSAVLPFAYVEGNGHFLYWLLRPGTAPHDWTVILNEGRGPEWEHYGVPAADFLLGVLTGTTDSSYFDPPTRTPRFLPDSAPRH
ncbi:MULTISPECIES: SMI1/KNR4 family protein [Streptomyces]|uniref:SMI1/KNR4 family protein n=1 Tax=Streptomyces TaxID=1883 RepID=UPI00163BA528|nr:MULTISPECIES: SMI1/KNR4 family protein [Streptomyces]MBC2874441.1 SMI1/KNR4 family protein [Streptomyces sp. TYQ1024]UBI40455.1 SMI1/KNR4 family protein [Streptomyces mobaraensis]UKW33037.1 SMI1/KNR4 family protein [Streptomyces sp. TYQ1024]